MVINYFGYRHPELLAKMATDDTSDENQDAKRMLPDNCISFGVMIVDDEKDILEILRRYLQKWNFEVDAFFDPFAALEKFRSRPDYYRVLITDLRMPGMTGVELANRLIDLKPGINIVLMTAFETDDIALPANASGSANVIKGQDILRKPFRLEQICQAVKERLTKE